MKKENIRVLIKAHAEIEFAAELDYLRTHDSAPKPMNWTMSPQSVVKYIMGHAFEDGFEIKPKYYGNRRIIEIAVATLATDRGLLLLGVPGTAKTWVSEHLSAAISNDSTLLVQGTSGMHEDALRYGWNYARLLSEGPSEQAMLPSPVMKAMNEGKMARIEELTRIPSDIQDALITILSEKSLPIPELNSEVMAVKGFNIIATANDRDKGIHDMSSALRRRFNTVILPLPATLNEELNIVRNRVEELGKQQQMVLSEKSLEEVKRLVTIFRELRSGQTMDAKQKLKIPSATLSPAEAISVINNGQALATHFGDGDISAFDMASGITGAIVKDPVQDAIVWKEYLETVVKERNGWHDLYDSCADLL